MVQTAPTAMSASGQRPGKTARSLTAESKDAVQSTYDLKFEGCRILTRMRKS